MQKAMAVVRENPAIAVRIAFIDKKIKKTLQDGIRQIVIIAAGMDSRSYRLDFPTGTTVFELEYLPSRWPFPVAPRDVPNIPRSFFVKATKL